MARDFLGSFLGENSRARVLRVFVLHPGESFTLSQVGKRSGIGGKALLEAVQFLERLDIIKKKALRSSVKGKKQLKKKAASKKAPKDLEQAWTFKNDFKHARALSSFIYEISNLHYEAIVEALKNSGRLSTVIISGCFMGDSTRPVDMIVVADDLNEERLEYAIKGLEPLVGREIRYASFETPEFRYRLTIQDRLVRDTLDYPHKVLLDRKHLL